VETVQAALTASDKALASALVDPCTAHITLAVLCLETPEDLERATLALRHARCKHGIRNGTARRTFGLSGLGHFKNEVLFVRVVPDETLLVLDSLAASVKCARVPLCLSDSPPEATQRSRPTA
jgi:2'-5' RNA ligase